MIPIIMNEKNLELFPAIDYVANLCKELMHEFIETRAKLPSWGLEIDREVSIYVDGLSAWMIGILNWSFLTERYFGKVVANVRATRIVKLAQQI